MSNASESDYSKKSPLSLISIYVLVGLLVYGAIYYFAFYTRSGNKEYSVPKNESTNNSNPAKNEIVTEEEVENVSIILTIDGFEPANVNIKTGTQITWTNESGQVATVNSGPHPVHTEYDPLNFGEFDDGQSHSLVFNEPGEYHYHNHYDETQSGVITVE